MQTSVTGFTFKIINYLIYDGFTCITIEDELFQITIKRLKKERNITSTVKKLLGISFGLYMISYYWLSVTHVSDRLAHRFFL